MSQQHPSKHLRRNKFPLPRLQWKLISAFAGLSALSLLTQYVLLSARLSNLAAVMPVGGEYLADALPKTLMGVLAFSLFALLPMSMAVGVLVTFKWAGPLYRFHVYLRETVAGTANGPCHIREKDELQELCSLINQALETARRSSAPEANATDASVPPARHDQAA